MVKSIADCYAEVVEDADFTKVVQQFMLRSH